MMLQALTICALLGLHTLSSLAGTIDPALDTNQLVMTPGGLLPKANIHAVPEGAHVHHTQGQVQIIGANGNVLKSVPVSEGVSSKLNPPSSPRHTARRALQEGYIAYAIWQNPGPNRLSLFNTTWPVPPIPANNNGQLLYWFNGLEPNSFDAILQPVLQYGVSPAGGGNFYAVAPWYVKGDNAFHGTLTPVQPGQQLTGAMRLSMVSTIGSQSNYTWSCSFPGISTSLGLLTTSELTWALEALEIYTTPLPTDLPAGHTAFTGINIRGPTLSSIGWEFVNDDTDHVSMSLVSAAATNGAMQLNYPQ